MKKSTLRVTCCLIIKPHDTYLSENVFIVKNIGFLFTNINFSHLLLLHLDSSKREFLLVKKGLKD